MGGSNKPEQPAYQEKTYNNGYGDTATQNQFNPSSYNTTQMNWVKSVTPQLQSKLFDQSSADNQARAYADNLKAQGLKRFKQDQADTLGVMQANSAKRFGSLSNSDYDTNLKTLARENNSALEDMNSQYDANYQNALNNYQNYYTNLLGTASGVGSNLYNLANGLSQNALASSNAINGFNQQGYQTAMSGYAADQATKAAMYQALGNAASGVGGAYGGYMNNQAAQVKKV